jgi:prepilin-type N-terminal cleavage/methylation domain-containing protein
MVKLSSNNYGFTLFELIIVTLIIGILSVIVVPSFLGFLTRAKVNNGLSLLQGNIQITQREAMKRSKSCILNLPNNNTKDGTLSSTCSSTGDRKLKDVFVVYNNPSGQKINFNFRGHTSPLRTIVIYHPDTKHKRCVVVSNGIGMVRTGVYTNDNLATISATHCQTSQ